MRGRVPDHSHGELHMTHFTAFLKNEQGATAIEYGLIAALISVAAIGAMAALGGQLSTLFTNIQTNLGR